MEIQKILQVGNFDWLNKLYTNYLPTKAQSDTSQTIGLITPYKDAPDRYGNDTFNAIKSGIKLTIFYKLGFKGSMTQINIDVMQLMIKNHWRIADSKAIYPDPDTKQSIKVFYLEKINHI